jgi:ATP-dependent DNA helicase RecG
VTTIAELEALVARPRENQNLEFKEAKDTFATPKIYRYCVAIANEGGGKLILGVTNGLPRQIVGTAAIPDTDHTASQIFNKLRFRVDVEALDHTDGRVVIFHIPSRPRGTAYQYEGAFLMRSTEETVSMSEDRLRKIFDEGKPNWLSSRAVESCTAEDVVRLLDTQSYFDMLNLPYPSTRDSVLERFRSEQLIETTGDAWQITNLGAILFAKRLADVGLTRKAPRVIVYDGTSKLNTRLDKPGGKGYAVGFEGLIDFVGSLVPTNEVVTKALRQEVRMFPIEAIRELVANALIHQDFTETGTAVRIELYDDRLEISNPGQPSIPTERFIDEYQSRNETLASLMRRLGICEEKGSGIDRVVFSCEFNQLPAPDFRVGDVNTTIVLFSHQEFEEMDRTDRIRACYQHCCLKYVTNERMTNQTLRERFKLPDGKTESVSRVLRDTAEAGKIKLADPTATSTRYRSYVPFWA